MASIDLTGMQLKVHDDVRDGPDDHVALPKGEYWIAEFSNTEERRSVVYLFPTISADVRYYCTVPETVLGLVHNRHADLFQHTKDTWF